jgi:hypothetical protein
MIIDIIPEAYDVNGKSILYPRKKKYGHFAPNAPMGRHITQPLSVQCKSIEEIHKFLTKCRYVSDQEQFGVVDYWMPPEEFEKRRQGDCDDFALWVWRQLIAMGKEDARFVVGRSGLYKGGHAWLTFREGQRSFLLDPVAHGYGMRLPRLRIIRYIPQISVAWDGKQLKYYEHEEKNFNPPLYKGVPLAALWLMFWLKTRPLYCYAWGRYFYRRIFKKAQPVATADRGPLGRSG